MTTVQSFPPTAVPTSPPPKPEATTLSEFGAGQPDAASRLDEIMARLQLAHWEAWDRSLELIRVTFSGEQDAVWAFEPVQVAAGVPWEQSIYPRDRERVKTFLTRPDNGRPSESIDYRVIVADGELLWIRHWPLARAAEPDGRFRLRGLLMAIPDQKHLEWECLRVSEHECNRVGQELHDDLCQVLAGLSFMMRVIGQRASLLAPALAREIEELNTHVIAATDRVRSMAHGLFPAQLNYASVRAALKEFADQIKARFKVDVALALPRRLPPHNPDQTIHVFRIAQEAVTNAVRHGKARTIRITIAAHGGEIQMEVADDGNGFPEPGHRREGIGTHIMRYRAGVLGGRLEFGNLAPHGAVVRLVYPALLAPLASRNSPPPTP